MTEDERFLSKVVCLPGVSGCWEWSGSKTRLGYGVFAVNDGSGHWQSVRAHRYAWERVAGPIPPGKHVLHRCDNPACVRLAHLFLGNHTDNMRDAATKGRLRVQKLGPSRNPRARLTWDDVDLIRTSSKSRRELAEQFDVSRDMIRRIVSGQSWRV